MSTATIEPAVVQPAAAPAGDLRGRRRELLSLAVVVVVAAALVFYELGSRSLWLDESATFAIATQHGASLWHAIAHDGGNMLGYYLLVHVLIGVIGHAPAVLRAPSAAGTVATVALVWLIARRLFDRRAALAAGLLAAVSLPLVFWGQDARGYALMMTFIAASYFFFIPLVEGPRSRWVGVAYGAATVLAIYMSFVAALIVPAQLLSLAWRRQRLRAVAVPLVGAVVCSVPIAVLALARGSGQLFWVPGVSLHGVGEMTRWLTSSGLPPNFHRTATSTTLLVLSLLLLAVVIVAALRAARRGSWPALMLVCWLVVPVALTVLESIFGQPLALARNSLVALPAASLLLAWGLTHERVPLLLGWSLLAAVIALRALQLVPSYGSSPENWKAASAYVLGRTTAGDCIAFYPADGRMAFDYYLGKRFAAAPSPVLPSTPWRQVRPYVESYGAPSSGQLAAIASACGRVWLIGNHVGDPQGTAGARAHYATFQALHASLRTSYTQDGEASFGWADPVRVTLLSR